MPKRPTRGTYGGGRRGKGKARTPVPRRIDAAVSTHGELASASSTGLVPLYLHLVPRTRWKIVNSLWHRRAPGPADAGRHPDRRASPGTASGLLRGLLDVRPTSCSSRTVDHHIASLEGADPFSGAPLPRRRFYGGNGLSTSTEPPRTTSASSLPTLSRSSSNRTERAVGSGYSHGAQRGLLLAVESPSASRRRFSPSTAAGGAAHGSVARVRRARHRRVGEITTLLCAILRLRRVVLRSALRGAPSTKRPRTDRLGLETTAACSSRRILLDAQTDRRAAALRVRSPRCWSSLQRSTGSRLGRAARAPGQLAGSLLLVEGGGHAPHARDPIMFNAAVRDFVERLR